MSRRVTPPVKEEPTCWVCDSHEVTQESMENGPPLCEEHDTDLLRERADIETRLQRVGEARAHGSQRLHNQMSQREYERIQDRLSELGEQQADLYQQQVELQRKCTHERADITQEQIEQEDFEEMGVPEDEWPVDGFPFTHYQIHCVECGLRAEHDDAEW